MPTTQTIPIDLNTRGANPVAFTHQGDTARAFAFEVYNNGVAFDLTGYTAQIGAILPADRGYTVIAGNDMATGSISENTITATLPAAYTAKAGHGILTIILTGSGGTLRPINIDLRIQKSADSDEVIEGASDFPEGLEEIAESVFQEYLNTYLPPVAPSSSADANKAASAKLTGQELDNLKSDLSEMPNVTGRVSLGTFERGLRYINNGAEAYTNDATRIRLTQGQYYNFQKGDVVTIINPIEYNMIVGYSSDGGLTWAYSGNVDNKVTIADDSIGFVSIRKLSGSFAENDNFTAIAKTVVEIHRPSAVDLERQRTEAMMLSNGVTVAEDFVVNTIYVNTTSGRKVTDNDNGNFCRIAAEKNEVCYIKADIEVQFPSNYTSYGLCIYEASSAYATLKTTDISDLSNVIEYVVSHNNTKSLSFMVYVVTADGVVTRPYRDTAVTKIAVAKSSGGGDVYTEAGQIWEV